MKMDLKKLKAISKNLTVLYVEDDDILRDSIYKYLKRIFKDIVCAIDGKNGLELYKDRKFDIVITDIEMPNLNGIDMSKNIKKLDKDQEIIIISAYTNTNYFVNSIQIGISGYIIKPIEYSQMNDILYRTAIRVYEHKKIIEYEKYLEEKVKKEIEKNKINQEILLEQSKMAAMGEMLESIAHQWRQPLSVITTAASSIQVQKEFDLLNDDKLVEITNTIVDSAEHLSQTIDDFRDFFKPNKEKVLFKLKDSFHRATELLSSKFKNREIEIIENIDDIEIFGLSNELVQVFMNILSNSKDALEEIKDKKRLIFTEIHKQNNDIIITIKDSGDGIPEDIIDKVFDSHFTTKDDKRGTGIGLYMTQRIIVEHIGGKISVENKDYKYNNKSYRGAQFIITLPVLPNLSSKK